MGFPFDTPTWDAASGPIFMGFGTAAPGIYSVLGLIICVGALIVGQRMENAKYAKHK